MDFEQIYKEYFFIVYRYILSVSFNAEIAEEITQDTFFKALKNIDKFRGESSIRIWLCQIAKNEYFDYIKKQRKIETFDDDKMEDDYSIEGELFQAVDIKEIHKALHNLKEPYKEVFSLRVFGELSFSYIAELFGKSVSWAKVTYHRAKQMIRKDIENE